MAQFSKALAMVVLLHVIIPGITTQADFDSTDLKDIVHNLATQVQMTQFLQEDRVRSEGGSGLKQQRNFILGPKPYHTQTHTGFKIAGYHNHGDNNNTVGMGELILVMNGVEFQTRHNDYMLVMPHRTSQDYNLVEEIPRPEVPPAVLNAGNAYEQTLEMRKWFEAWANQDHSERDYRPYFKPVLCYVEAGWTTKVDQLEEAFPSDRHFIDADGWNDLYNKIRFTSYTGRKNPQENFAKLPRKIMNVTEDGIPVYAQWNYRILCHPLNEDLPLSHLVQEDDVQARLVYRKTFDEWKETRGARFSVQSPSDGRHSQLVHLDKLMMEIPGRNNYQGNLREDTLGELYTHPDGSGEELNVARFHRRYTISEADASGLTKGKRGFSDSHLWVAETDKDEIAPMYMHHCHKGQCYEALKRVTYAIPLEIIYLTPLHNWNPHGVEFVEDPFSSARTNNGVRNGGFTPETAYAYEGKKLFFHTPLELFTSSEDEELDPADTGIKHVGMLGSDGLVHNVTASGILVFLPEIPGVGRLRQRYPIMPIHGESSSVWKELIGLREIVMKLTSYQKYLYEDLSGKALTTTTTATTATTAPTTTTTTTAPTTTTTTTAPTTTTTTTAPTTTTTAATTTPKPKWLWTLNYINAYTHEGHSHSVNISREESKELGEDPNNFIMKTTTMTNGHFHELKVVKIGSGIFFSEIDGAAPADGVVNKLKWHEMYWSNGVLDTRDIPYPTK